ncbi:MAG: aminotransferase class III-fold pyridoxal phosphate-dependent enzyme [Flavobacteriales bacterium]|nr:aminotransferase class III-fold pyridoxal phosphate-dependent enzyme [Flavobacteriales bacterium]
MSDLRTSFLAHLAQTSPFPIALDIVGAEGCHLQTRDGKRYLDLVAGLAVNNVGHRQPKVVAAIKAQADKYLHVIPYGEFIQGPQVRFAETLTSLLPAGLDSIYLVNSGTEANEAALKLASASPGAPGWWPAIKAITAARTARSASPGTRRRSSATGLCCRAFVSCTSTTRMIFR